MGETVVGLVLITSTIALVGTVTALAMLSWRNRRQQQVLDTLERDLERAHNHLRRRAEMAQELAHEIKNPLGAIVASAEALELLLQEEVATAHREALGYIKEYSAGLLQQVSDFLDLTRAEGGLVRARPERVPLCEAARSVAGLLRSIAVKRGVHIAVVGDEEQKAAFIDPTHCKQVLFNLIHNAIKFSPRNSTVSIAVQRVGSSEFVAVSVSDEGPGIPPELREKIFEPHVQGSQAVRHELGGYGIGLAVCRTLVELAGGKIAAYCSEAPGSCGTTFMVTLPRASHTEAIVRAPETELKLH